MQEFNFNVDLRIAAWKRNTVTVKAENLEDARRKLLAIDSDVFAGSDDLPEDVELKSSMILNDGIDYYSNDAQLTYQIFDETANETIFSKIEVVSNNPITNLGNLESVSGGLKLI